MNSTASTFWPMKRSISLVLLFCLIFFQSSLDLSQAAFLKKKAETPKRDFLPPVATINGKHALHPESEEDPLEPVTLSAISSPTVKTSQPIVKIDTDLGIRTSLPEIKDLLTAQKSLEDEEMKRLWEATVEKNPVIRFSLEKITTPRDLRPKKSSQFLNKTLNVLISGAALAATMAPGASYYRNMGAMAGGDAIKNVMNGKSQPQGEGLSPTEQIQLAGLVDELQAKLVHAYHDYKNTLQALIAAHQLTVKNSTLYNQASTNGNDLAILASGTAYYKALLAESGLRQKAKIARVQLERLAGPEAVSGLQFSILPEGAKTEVSATKPTLEPNLPLEEKMIPPSAPKEAPTHPETTTSSVLDNNTVPLPPAPEMIKNDQTME